LFKLANFTYPVGDCRIDWTQTAHPLTKDNDMTNKQLTEIIKAMMYSSGLDPLLEEDFYQNLTGTSIGQFLEGVVSYFDLKRDSWVVHFVNLEYLDSPSETIEFFIKNKHVLFGE